MLRLAATRARWLVVAPFGRPVVPEVCRIMLGPSGSMTTSGRRALAARQQVRVGILPVHHDDVAQLRQVTPDRLDPLQLGLARSPGTSAPQLARMKARSSSHEPRVHRRLDHARLGDGEVDLHELEPVAHEQRRTRALGRGASSNERVGEPRRAVAHLREAQPPVAVDDGHAIARSGGSRARPGQRCWSPYLPHVFARTSQISPMVA